MNVENLISTQRSGSFQLSRGADQVSEARKARSDVSAGDQAQKKQIQPEEMLQQIQALTEDGLYSVRFEKDSEIGEMVVKVVDQESGEVIRQIPPEELLDLSRCLSDLRGNIVDTEG
jgi:flagellar protein FlaG